MRRTTRPARSAHPLFAAAVFATVTAFGTLPGAASAAPMGTPGATLPPQPKTPEPQVPFTALAHVEVRGNGPIPLILIPGLACDWTVFDTFMTRNATKYTMYAVTLAGFGGSPAPATPATPPTGDAWLTNTELAVLKMIEEKKLDQPVIAGHAMGGHIAYRLAARHPEAFRAAISIDGLTWLPLQDLSKGNVPGESRRASVEGQLGATILKQRTDAMWKKQAADAAPQLSKNLEAGQRITTMMATVPSAVAARYFLEYLAGDLTAEVNQIRIPTLAIIAISDLEDPLRPRLQQRSIRLGQVADAKAVTAIVFEDTRNMVTEDRPEDLDKVVGEFLSGKPVTGAAKTGTMLGAGAPPANPAPSNGAAGSGADKK